MYFINKSFKLYTFKYNTFNLKIRDILKKFMHHYRLDNVLEDKTPNDASDRSDVDQKRAVAFESKQR